MSSSMVSLLVGSGMLLVFAGFGTGIYVGGIQVKLHTVVRLETPYYKGVFFGKCWSQDASKVAPSIQACATLDNE